MLTILTTMQGKARQSRRKANKTVTPRVSHVTAGRACHMLPWGARVTCYSGAPLSHGRGEDVDRKEFFFCLHDTRQFTAKVRSVRSVRQSVQLCNHLERSSQGLLGLIREQGIESLNQAIRCSPLDDCTDLAGKPS